MSTPVVQCLEHGNKKILLSQYFFFSNYFYNVKMIGVVWWGWGLLVLGKKRDVGSHPGSWRTDRTCPLMLEAEIRDGLQHADDDLDAHEVRTDEPLSNPSVEVGQLSPIVQGELEISLSKQNLDLHNSTKVPQHK
ncbi:MAG: hypothetical protein COV59_02585 [Candidatus Magasanikbacteria bacterium CG11_big_fil_rev_8_21_14_0_20_39_34]|uniref:Uncharacterized protein n=1 Tax=Candidatus Magasanikbacteria bacterium CG11_big_fil_rev_8_21_14_0_20_39_34 TaxID=1974653 RepID=A0A2H0N564_9BACT|nr:MAG: hypothetical protein COV59_02585 [Candidatus Magasanikbacteria bacterium CG11_big_fil_rev_8_21_14_0_20_39_34]